MARLIRRFVHRAGEWADRVRPDMAAFFAAHDSFDLGTASAADQPYIQLRGGPKGTNE